MKLSAKEVAGIGTTVISLVIVFVIIMVPQVLTASGRAQLGAWNNSGHVTLYSGGKLVREWDSVGKVREEEQSDGWYFQDSKTRKLVRVSGTVVVED